ncbi:MAG: hypothetical protein M3Y93_14050, partial [Pseudomonadota bacterium]|nr:hypothetical protein [Pseudomonadota bacterium]
SPTTVTSSMSWSPRCAQSHRGDANRDSNTVTDLLAGTKGMNFSSSSREALYNSEAGQAGYSGFDVPPTVEVTGFLRARE